MTTSINRPTQLFDVYVDASEPGIRRIEFRGELDLLAVNRRYLDIVTMVATPVGGTVAVDLSGLTFIDSTGLRVIIEMHHTVQGNGDRFVVERVSAAVIRVLEATKLLGFFDIESDLGTAV